MNVEQILKTWTPAGWKVRQEKSRRKGMSGHANPATRIIRCPVVQCDESLAVFLHECGHVYLEHLSPHYLDHVAEYEAWRFSFAVMRALHIAPRHVTLTEAKRRVQLDIQRDQRKNQTIAAHILTWANSCS